jgi:predicted SnoaL-like aldol condensation-catalyzing enzyme
VKEAGLQAHTELVLTQKDTDYVFERWFSPPYLQHNPFLASGTEAVKAFKKQFVPGTKTTFFRVISEGDIIAIHQSVIGFSIVPDAVGVDFYRLRGNKIVEHWDAMEPSYGGKSGMEILSGERELTDIDQTEINRELVRAFVKNVLIGGQTDKFPDYVSPNLIEHCPQIEQGSGGLKAYLESGSTKWQRFGRVLGEGNFVWSSCYGTFDGKPFVLYDLYRVAGGKIVEHWRVKQPVAEKTASGLEMLLE